MNPKCASVGGEPRNNSLRFTLVGFGFFKKVFNEHIIVSLGKWPFNPAFVFLILSLDQGDKNQLYLFHS